MRYPENRRMRPLDERFVEKVAKTESCWEWTGLVNAKGYGRMGVRRAHRRSEMVLAHRLAWELEHGEVPAGACVLHRCDNPRCVRVAHLFLGTRAENNDDMISKGRGRAARGGESGRRKHPELWPRGADVPNAKLTVARVAEIRQRYAAGGTSFVRLARAFGVGRTTIENIVKRRKWAHVRVA